SPLFLPASPHHRALHSFPTRRSSDLFGPCFADVTATRDLRLRAALAILRLFEIEHHQQVVFRRLHGIAWMREPHHRLRLSADERSEEHTSELQSRENLVCRLLLEKKK